MGLALNSLGWLCWAAQDTPRTEHYLSVFPCPWANLEGCIAVFLIIIVLYDYQRMQPEEAAAAAALSTPY